MTTLDYILVFVSIASFLLAVTSYVRSSIKKATESANIAILRQQMDGLYLGLVAVLHGVDAIVQIAKQESISNEELANIARVTRGHAFVLLAGLKHYQGELSEWRFGVMIKSKPFDHATDAEGEVMRADDHHSATESERRASKAESGGSL